MGLSLIVHVPADRLKPLAAQVPRGEVTKLLDPFSPPSYAAEPAAHAPASHLGVRSLGVESLPPPPQTFNSLL